METKEHKQVPKTTQQKIWNYLRRNRKESRVSDLRMILGVDPDRIRRYMTALQRAGYTREITGEHYFAKRAFALTRYTGVLAPLAKYNEGVVIDRNTGESCSIKRVPVFMKVRFKILELCDRGEEIRIRNLTECGGRTTVKRELQYLVSAGVLKIQKKERGFVYRANRTLLNQLIQKGETDDRDK